MKKKTIAITLMFTLLLALFSSMAVYAGEDDHGADAHSDSMTNIEELEDEGEVLSFQDQLINVVVSYAPYVLGAIGGIVVIVIIVKVIRKNRKPRYTGKH